MDARERVRAWQAAHPERVRAHKRAYYLRHRDEQIAATRARLEANLDEKNRTAREWRARNPEKMEAYRAYRRALKLGDLVRGECEQADGSCSGRIEGHHDDYSRPLDVRWLCCFHHGIEHRRVA